MDSSAEGSEMEGEMTALVHENAGDQGVVVGDEEEHLQNRYRKVIG